jgi:fused signal recognition particle receptor
MGFFDKIKETLGFEKIKDGLTKTRDAFTDKIGQIIAGANKIDDELLEEIEEAMIQADIGVHTTMRIINEVRKTIKKEQTQSPQALYDILAQKIAELMGKEITPLNQAAEGPTVILVVGVNGVGKTTTIGKLAYQMKQAGQKVLLAAGDTFRAAAIEQLEIWGQRAGVDVIKQAEGSDPAAVAYDAAQAATARKVDVLIMDTAGRLHNKANLMEELRKITRVINREIPGAPHEVLLVLDATTGQNAVIQAKIFQEVAGVTGVALTKLDGTAKGGVVVAISAELALPVKIIGVGEGINDLRLFDPEDFAAALFARDKE